MAGRNSILSEAELDKYSRSLWREINSNLSEISYAVKACGISEHAGLKCTLEKGRDAGSNDVQDFMIFYHKNFASLKDTHPLVVTVAENITKTILDYVKVFEIEREDLAGLRQIDKARSQYREQNHLERPVANSYPAYCNGVAALIQAIFNFKAIPELEKYFADKAQEQDSEFFSKLFAENIFSRKVELLQLVDEVYSTKPAPNKGMDMIDLYFIKPLRKDAPPNAAADECMHFYKFYSYMKAEFPNNCHILDVIRGDIEPKFAEYAKKIGATREQVLETGIMSSVEHKLFKLTLKKMHQALEGINIDLLGKVCNESSIKK